MLQISGSSCNVTRKMAETVLQQLHALSFQMFTQKLQITVSSQGCEEVAETCCKQKYDRIFNIIYFYITKITNTEEKTSWSSGSHRALQSMCIINKLLSKKLPPPVYVTTLRAQCRRSRDLYKHYFSTQI